MVYKWCGVWCLAHAPLVRGWCAIDARFHVIEWRTSVWFDSFRGCTCRAEELTLSPWTGGVNLSEVVNVPMHD